MVEIPLPLAAGAYSFFANPHYIHQFGPFWGTGLHVLVAIGSGMAADALKSIIAPKNTNPNSTLFVATAVSISMGGLVLGYWGTTAGIDSYIMTGKLQKQIKQRFSQESTKRPLSQQEPAPLRIVRLDNGSVYACLPKPRMG